MSATDDFDQFDDAPDAKPARKTAAKKAAPAKRATRRTSSKIPANAPKPQDRNEKALTARELEAAGGVEEVEIFGEIFKLDTDAFAYSFDLHEGFSDGNGLKIVRGALGNLGWEKLKAISLRDHITIREAIEHASEVIAQSQGFKSMGN